MSIRMTEQLNIEEKKQVTELVGTGSFPMEDADFYLLYEKQGELLAAAALIAESDEVYECVPFTAVQHRRQGLFSELLDEAFAWLPEDAELMFYTNGTCPDALATLEALEAECVLEEHMMELELRDFGWNPLAEQVRGELAELHETSNELELLHISMEKTTVDGTNTYVYSAPCGIVNISVFSSYYYLYGLEIHEELRGRGCGKWLLHTVLSDLAARNPLPLRLQVSGDNTAALALYNKTGFRITETLSGYLY